MAKIQEYIHAVRLVNSAKQQHHVPLNANVSIDIFAMGINLLIVIFSLLAIIVYSHFQGNAFNENDERGMNFLERSTRY